MLQPFICLMKTYTGGRLAFFNLPPKAIELIHFWIWKYRYPILDIKPPNLWGKVPDFLSWYSKIDWCSNISLINPWFYDLIPMYHCLTGAFFWKLGHWHGKNAWEFLRMALGIVSWQAVWCSGLMASLANGFPEGVAYFVLVLCFGVMFFYL